MISDWITNNYIEIFGAVTGIIVCFSGDPADNLAMAGRYYYICRLYLGFFHWQTYADMSLQGYYLVISLFGWYWWAKGSGLRAAGQQGKRKKGQGQEHRTQGRRKSCR